MSIKGKNTLQLPWQFQAKQNDVSNTKLSTIPTSGFYDEIVSEEDGTTRGEAILIRFGFSLNGEA